jgi:hypothetical protein
MIKSGKGMQLFCDLRVPLELMSFANNGQLSKE